MRDRVRNDQNYLNRGIQVCDRWRDFSNFLHDMGERPEGSSLDRIDNSGHYERDNCRWTTTTVQNRNKGNNVLVTSERFQTTKPLEEWVCILISQTGDTTWNRRSLTSYLKRWSIDKILTAEGITSLSEQSAHDFTEPYLIAA